jgi:hypothetical protein
LVSPYSVGGKALSRVDLREVFTLVIKAEKVVKVVSMVGVVGICC